MKASQKEPQRNAILRPPQLERRFERGVFQVLPKQCGHDWSGT